jgi:hypothetical protein
MSSFSVAPSGRRSRASTLAFLLPLRAVAAGFVFRVGLAVLGLWPGLGPFLETRRSCGPTRGRLRGAGGLLGPGRFPFSPGPSGRAGCSTAGGIWPGWSVRSGAAGPSGARLASLAFCPALGSLFETWGLRGPTVGILRPDGLPRPGPFSFLSGTSGRVGWFFVGDGSVGCFPGDGGVDPSGIRRTT